MERLKARGILTQVEGHVGVRDAAQHAKLLAECGFASVQRPLPRALSVRRVAPPWARLACRSSAGCSGRGCS